MKVKALTARKLEQSITQYTILMVLILAIGAYFAYQNYMAFSRIGAGLDSINSQTVSQQKVANQLSGTYSQAKTDFETQNTTLYTAIDNVLPLTEDFTNLARTLDKYFLDNNSQAAPLFLSDLRFNSSQLPPDKDYSILPFSMSISGNYGAFKKFLQFIQSSGDLNTQTRLMDLSTVNITLSEPTSQTAVQSSAPTDTFNLDPKDVSASLSLKAYFKKQAPTQQ